MMFFDRAMYLPPLPHIPLKLTRLQVSHGQRNLSPPSLPTNLVPNTTTPKILFLIGLTLLIGTAKTLSFFARKQKWKGTAAFVLGITLILMKWAFFGFIIELYGILVLFGDFFATIAGFAGGIPIVGPYIARGLNALGGVAKSQESAV
jgi:hypothetical protein